MAALTGGREIRDAQGFVLLRDFCREVSDPICYLFVGESLIFEFWYLVLSAIFIFPRLSTQLLQYLMCFSWFNFGQGINIPLQEVFTDFFIKCVKSVL